MDLIGKTLGHYQIVSKIASGGMADVYKARQESLDRIVAIKILPAALSRDETFRARFEQEARAVAQLHHPSILTVFDYGEQDGLTYIVMEYAPGGTLKDRLTRPLPLDEAIDITCQLGNALAYAHRRGVVHRDVKPSNVLLTEEGWPMLSDFGLAKMVQGGQALTSSGVSIGTPEYMSPEQGQGLPVDHRSDIYALGVMLYEMVTGRTPYHAETPLACILKHMTEPLPPPRKFRPELPVGVESVIIKTLAKAPRDRYGSAAEMARSESAPRKAETLPNIVLPPSMVSPAARPKKRLPLWALGAMLALLVAGIALGWALGFREPRKSARATETAALVEMTLSAALTPTPQPTATGTATATHTPAPTSTPVPSTATPAPTPTPPPPTATSTATHTPVPEPTATPAPQAIARLSSSVFRGPTAQTEELAVVDIGAKVEILGRADETKYGRWLYVRTGKDIMGFVYEPRFDYEVDWESLPLHEAQGVEVPPPASARLKVTPGPLQIVHVWPGGTCNADGGWTAYFEVKISGGNGTSYAIFWDQQEVRYTIKPEERDIAVFERPADRNLILGTVWVESGGERVGQEISAKKPDHCN
jgi:serine/threonine protein kinase